MIPGPHVFGDRRLGCWIVDLAHIADRASKLRALGITDLFLRGPDGTLALKQKVLGLDFVGCHAYWSVDGLTADEYASRCLADIWRWNPGAGDLNVELGSDALLEPFMRRVVGLIRARRRAYRLRLVIAPQKAGFVPVDLLQEDPHLFVAIENYGGNMDALFSAPDQERALREAGVPDEKVATCYAGACTVGGVTGSQRVNTIPLGWGLKRGVIFTDNLLAEAGLL